MKICCETLKECMSLFIEGKPGLVKVSLANRNTGKISETVGYKKTRSMKAPVYTVKFCPFCGDEK